MSTTKQTGYKMKDPVNTGDKKFYVYTEGSVVPYILRAKSKEQIRDEWEDHERISHIIEG